MTKYRDWETLKKVREDMSTLLTKIEAVAGRPVNPNSSAGVNSLANILYKHLRYPVIQLISFVLHQIVHHLTSLS